MSDEAPKYDILRVQAGVTIAVVKDATHVQTVGIVKLVWGNIPDDLVGDRQEPTDKGEWKFHLGGTDWMLVKRHG